MTFNRQANMSMQYLSKCDCGDVTYKPPFHSQHQTANKTSEDEAGFSAMRRFFCL